MAIEEIHTADDLVRIIHEQVEKNVIPTGVGSIPNLMQDGKMDIFYQTANTAAQTFIERPSQKLDRELIKGPTVRTTRIIAGIAKTKQEQRFIKAAKPKITPIQEIEVPGGGVIRRIIRPEEGAPV